MSAVEVPLVSVIMPTYNAEPYIGEAIASVLAQTWTNWELIIVNDGSTDGTAEVIARFNDPRIRVFHKTNGGIGCARNTALDNARGGFVCLFDSDDVLPPRSLEARVRALLDDPDAWFADGVVRVYDRELRIERRVYHPSFTGEPLIELVTLTGSCFFGPSWMVRWSPDISVRFNTEVTHAEDLLFFIQLSPGRRYIHTPEDILYYRVTGHSTMSNLDGLGRSYRYLCDFVARELPMVPRGAVKVMRRKVRRIMAGTFWKAGRHRTALRWFLLGS